MGSVETIRNRNHGGVIRSRFIALEKNGNTSSLGRSSHSWDRKLKIRIGDLAFITRTAYHT